jgi:hypothetical protein
VPVIRRASLGALALLACTGRLEHEPSAFFGGAVAVTDGGASGAGGRAIPLDGPPRSPAPDEGRLPPAPPPDAAPPSEPPDAAAPWDGPSLAADTAPLFPPMPDAAPSACAPGQDALALIGARCGGCHNAMSAAKGLDLRSPGLGARTVGVASSCQGRPLLVNGPGAPVGHMLDKIEGPVPGCGNQMPAGGPALSDQEKACVREWAAQAITKVQNAQSGR